MQETEDKLLRAFENSHSMGTDDDKNSNSSDFIDGVMCWWSSRCYHKYLERCLDGYYDDYLGDDYEDFEDDDYEDFEHDDCEDYLYDDYY